MNRPVSSRWKMTVAVCCAGLLTVPGGRADKKKPVPPAQQLAYGIGAQLIGNLLNTRKSVNRLTIQRPTAERLSTELKSLLKNRDLKIYRLAVVGLDGKVLVCEPAGDADQVKARPLYQQVLKQIAISGKEFITQARMSPEQRLTYDVFLPLRRQLDYQSEVIGFFHANVEPHDLIKRVVTAHNFRADEIIYVLSDQGWLLYHSGPQPARYLELLDDKVRKQQSRYRVVWRKLFEDEAGAESLTALAASGLGVYRHRISWQHYQVNGATWLILHDQVRPHAVHDPGDLLTGTWQAFDANDSGREAPEIAFSASLVQYETWWRMRAVAGDWSFTTDGRFLEDQLTSNRPAGQSKDKPHVFLVNGTWDKQVKKLFLRVYWQMDKYNVKVRSYELVRSKGRAPKPPTRAKPRIPLRVLR